MRQQGVDTSRKKIFLTLSSYRKEKMMITKKSVSLSLSVLAMLTGLTACQRNEEASGKGPAEKTGEQIDRATARAGEELNKVGEKAGQLMQKAGEKGGEAVQKAGEKMEGASQEAQQSKEAAKKE